MAKSSKEVKEEIKEEIKVKYEENKKKLKAMGPVKLIILAIMIVGTICSYVFYDYIFGAKSGWCTTTEYGNTLLTDITRIVPRLVSCIQVVTIILLGVTVVLAFIRKFFTKTQRSITVSSLVCNLIRWVTAIILLITILKIGFNVDTTALITGAGVVTLVVGLGMQSLIADIVAGLFIVFENEFNVGDWLEIDDFYGQVVSIGIRTTKLKSFGNIKIINNNEIHGVINRSVEPSVALACIDVEYGAKLPEVERIIKENIDSLKVPGALGAVRYDGVTNLGASGVTIRFQVDCYEEDYYSVGRALNGAIKNMFDENGISIPLPQIVVHNDD